MPIWRLSGGKNVYFELDISNSLLGSGATGKVYRAFRVNLETRERIPVAIKFLYENLPTEAIERARREAQIHIVDDHLIEMLGFFELVKKKNGRDVHRYHVVSEYLQGIRLDKKLNEFIGDLESFSIDVVTGVLKGLSALHKHGYIHRDIDMSNVMLLDDGRVKLIDFGIAKLINQLESSDKHLTNTGQFLGRPEYAAPELVLGDINNQNATTDIYAVGILLYRLLVGEFPFQGSDAQILAAQWQQDVPVKNIKNRKLRKIVKKATEKKQSDRYQSADEFLAALQQKSRWSLWFG